MNFFLKFLFILLLSGIVCIASREEHIKTVHVVSMNHLDVGYANYSNAILNEYFTEYFDRAADLADQLRAGGYVENYIYTTHPWLVSLYLDCPPHLVLSNYTLQCPNSTKLKKVTEAIERGDIVWHAGPMNMQMENLDQSLLTFGIQLGDDLDKRFNITRKFKTLSQRDVPGMTQAVIPTFTKMGVKAISVGVNTMTSPPAVPNPFLWKYGEESILVTYHKGGYPDNPGANPRHPGGISRGDCTIVPGLTEALCFAFRTDNSGPPVNIQEILAYNEILRAEFPGAEIKASTFDSYIAALTPFKEKLPVITMEIGDTWIQGIASDPRKMAEYRAIRRVFSTCLKSGSCSLSDKRFYNASRFLLKPGEHTLGLDNVRDTINWSNAAFNKVKRDKNFRDCISSWVEQRNMTYLSVTALENHPIVPSIETELQNLKPQQPDLNGFQQVVVDPTAVHNCGSMSISFSMQGGISNLMYYGLQWASPWHQLGLFNYITYNETDFNKFGALYNYKDGYGPGYTKANVTKNAHPESRNWPVTMDTLYQRQGEKCDFYAHLKTVDSRPRKYYGAPADVWIRYTSRASGSGLDMTFQWFDKTPTRLPEALVLAFNPAPRDGYKYFLDKIGQMVDPTNVITNGSQRQHAVDTGFYFKNESDHGLKITTLDVPIACISTSQVPATVFPAPLQTIKEEITGIAFNFYNNIWDTNFIFWYPYLDEDANYKARFNIDFLM